MRKSYVMAAMAAAMMLVSCGTKQSATVTANNYRSASPFGEVSEAPGAENDTEEYFGATGIAYGSKTKMGELQLIALTNAQNMIRQKMKHAYKGAVDDYSGVIGNNEGNDIVSKIERGGTQIIDVIVNNTQASKGPLFSNVDEKGNVSCFLGIRISKQEAIDKVMKSISEDEELKIRFKEDEFRKRMQQSFKDFKENK